jgi:hypothetical protein
MADISSRLASVLDDLPVAVALVSASGHLLGKSGGLSDMLGDMIPAQDRQASAHWSFIDADGATIPCADWPTPRALRGERVHAGMIGTFRDSSGERRLKVISMPTADRGGEVAAIVFLQALDTPHFGVIGSVHALQQKLIDELARAVTLGWTGFGYEIDARVAS